MRGHLLPYMFHIGRHDCQDYDRSPKIGSGLVVSLVLEVIILPWILLALTSVLKKGPPSESQEAQVPSLAGISGISNSKVWTDVAFLAFQVSQPPKPCYLANPLLVVNCCNVYQKLLL
jgi:hypothetical protein